jgi:hypothetical protein
MPIKKKASASKPKRSKLDEERLAAATEFLDDHERSCLQTVETWMLRSLPVPRTVLQSVMVDESWAKVLRDAWVVPVTAEIDREAGGFFRAGRTIFLKGGYSKGTGKNLPMEEWKQSFYAGLSRHVITEPAHALFARAYKRITDGDS